MNPAGLTGPTMPETGTALDAIVRDVRSRLGELPEETISGLPAVAAAPAPRSLVGSVRGRVDAGELAVIAEVKRRSPSAGQIAADVDPATRAALYAGAGAAGISVLTEIDHFGGSLADLVAARGAAADVPVLRKDFVLDVRQLLAARRAGADAVLLIAALHDAPALRGLVADAHALGLEVLLEVHDEDELERALATDAALIGINARDLRTFDVDLGVVERLTALIPADRTIVAESGVRDARDCRRLVDAGAHAVLVGTTLMQCDDPGNTLRALRIQRGVQ